MNNQITYLAEYRVILGKRQVGSIRELYDATKGSTVDGKPGSVLGYRYFPKGDKVGGDIYPTLAACKLSLEN